MVAPPLWSAAAVHDMFTLALPVAEKMLRPALVYACLVVLLRIFGKRELAQLNPFDLVVLLSLSNTVQNAIIGDDNSVTGGIVGAVTLLGVNYLVVRFLFRHRRLDQLLEGRPAVLVEHGKVRAKDLARELLTHSELLTVIRRQGFSRIEEVESCVLEPGGVFLIQGKTPPVGDRRHAELLERLDGLTREVGALRERLGSAG